MVMYIYVKNYYVALNKLYRFWGMQYRPQASLHCVYIACNMADLLACESIRFSSLFAAGDISRGGNIPSGEELGETDAFGGYRFTRKIHV